MLSSRQGSRRNKYCITFFLLASSYIFAAETAIAQITSDGTLDSQVELTNQQNIITGGQEVGTNLFHSFEEFSPVPDAVTYFDNHPQIENIFTRVTGGMPSVIDGIIKTNNASLFLLNPSGIILGNNAELNINGSFIATTAEQVIFADGTTFRAQVGNDQPLLTLSLPIGLQYGTNPGAIVVSINKMDRINQSNSSDSPLNSGKTLALLGGEVTFNNAFIAPAFDVLEIAGVGQEATIKLENINDNWQFDYTNVTNFANIQLNQTTIDSSIVGNLGMPIIVNLQGENISLNSSVIFNSFNQTAQDGGKISLTATNSIKLNQSLLSTQSGILDEAGNPPFPAVTGKGGDIFVSGREIILNNGSQILAETVSAGAGGNITIQAQEYLAISGVASFPSSIAVTAADTSSGSGGNIHIETNRLNITDGGRIDSSTQGSGDAGVITIHAEDSISILGNNSPESEIFKSGIYAVSDQNNFNNITNSTGQGGSLSIRTAQLLLQEEGQISVENIGDKNAGDINILAEAIVLDQNSQIRANTNSGNGGSINLTSNQVILREQSDISVDAKGTGDGGNVMINTENLVLFEDSTIIANAEAGKGGNITIDTRGLFHFNIENNQIDASSDLGIDGEITIIAPDINSKIDTNLKEQSPISPEKLIYSGCGLNSDFTANQFRYIGRGGISPSPLTRLTEELVGELGTVEYIQEPPNRKTPRNIVSPSIPELKNSSIQEATSWIINDRGKIELVTQASRTPVIATECPFAG